MPSLQFCLIGSGDLALQCAQILVDQGHQLLAVVSRMGRIRSWADVQGIPWFERLADLKPASLLSEADHLLSVINGEILSQSVLDAPRRFSINYHNSPLPRYAGVHATTWSLLAGETTHGVTWHVMTREVDAGDVLKQAVFSVDPDETTFSLNLKCHEYALETFTELISELAQDNFRRQPQDLSRRTYFAGHRKVSGGGLVDWRAEAGELDRLSRALTFGTRPNRVGVPRVRVGERYFVPLELRVAGGSDEWAAAGTLLAVDGDGWRVACGEGAVVAAGLRLTDGRPVEPRELARELGLAVGDRLPCPDGEELAEFQRRVAEASPDEPYWISRLRRLRPVPVPFVEAAAGAEEGEVEGPTVFIGPVSPPPWPPELSRDERRAHLVAAILATLTRAAGVETASVWWRDHERPACSAFASHRPLTVTLGTASTVDETVSQVTEALAEVRRRGTYLLDVSLRDASLDAGALRLPVAIEVVEDVHSPGALPKVPRGTVLRVLLNADGGGFLLVPVAAGLLREGAGTALERFHRHTSLALGHFLTGVPGQRLETVPKLTPEERHQALHEWNDSRVEDDHVPAHRLVEQQAGRHPGAPAVVQGERRLTYAELVRHADRLARWLASRVVAEEPVLVAVDRGPELVVALLGILKAGACFLPVDSGHPEGRLRTMARDAGAGVLIAGPGVGGVLGDLIAHHLEASDLWDLPASRPAPPRPPVVPERLAYMMYTSGSTGRPKGVMSTHGGLSNRLAWSAKALPMAPGDRFLQVAAVDFDISVWEILYPLSRGACLVAMPPEEHRDPGLLVGEISARGITCAHFVPTLLEAFLQHPGAGECRTLRWVLTGGEAVSAPLVEAFHRCLDARLYQAYGPTEASISVTHGECPADGGGRPPLGRPMDNCRVHVLDERLEPTAVGGVGELHIGGIALARGYAADPVRTGVAFLPDPHATEPGLRLYRTGDLARRRADGRLEFIGRRDHQVKIRGRRVEMGEVEAVLLRQPDVRQAVVEVRASPSVGSFLVAYLVMTEAPASPPAEARCIKSLRQRMAAELPAHMVPSRFKLLEKLPLLRNGKVDRSRLPEPTDEPRETSSEPPRTVLERRVAGQWSRLLDVPRVGLHDDFFALGGHSMVAIKLVGWVREVLDVDLPLRTLFESPTLDRFTREIVKAGVTEGLRRCPPVPRSDLEDIFPLSFAQERVWFLDRLLRAPGLYNMPVVLRLGKPVPADSLAAAWDTLRRRHELLRSSIVEREGDLRLEIAAAGPQGALKVCDLSFLDEGRRRREAAALLRRDAARPFDLSRGPLARASLLRLAGDEHFLALTVHHAISDGWSTEILFAEWGELLGALAAGRPAVLPALPVRYGDFAVWQRSWLGDDRLEGLLDYWQRELAGASLDLELPLDRPRDAAAADRRAGHHRWRLEGAPLERLQRLADEVGTTLFMVLLAVLQVFLHRVTGKARPVVGSPFASRHVPNTERIVGLFANTVALTGDCSGAPPFDVLLSRVLRSTLEAHEHQEAPLEKVVERMAVERHPERHPLFQVMLVHNSEWSSQAMLGPFAGRRVPAPCSVALFDLTLTIDEEADGLSLELEYPRALFDATTPVRWAGILDTLFAAVAADPTRPVDRLPLMPEAEALQLQADPPEAPAPGLPVHLLVAARAAAHPDAEALRHSGGSLSYGGMMRRVESLATRLRAEGVGLEDRVAVVMERSPELVVALLAVMTVGAAYVPVDPALPTGRRRLLLSASRPRLALVDRAGTAGDLPTLVAGGAAEDVDTGAGTGRGVGGGLGRPAAVPNEAGAYVIFTSGSTGEPKGVLVSHGALANYVDTAVRGFELTPDDRVLQFASPSFDAAAEEIFPTLVAGATLVLRDDRLLESAAALLESCRRNALTVLDLPTAFFHQVVAELEPDPRPLPLALRLVVVGGERLLRGAVGAWFRLAADGPGAPRLVNTYGPTEATIVATRCTVEDGGGALDPPIGRAVDGVQAHVLDRRLGLLPPQIPGELYLSGRGLARGYFDRPRDTAECFLPSPFGAAGSRLYRTGDRARRGAGADLRFLGRGDRQVKVRGYRVEPGEIEARLLSHPAVRHAVVAVRAGTAGDRLLAWVVAGADDLRRPGRLEVDLRHALEGVLPAWMVPSRILPVKALPVTATGKVDVASLPDGVGDDGVPGDAPPERSRPPRDGRERALAVLWREVLGVPVARVDDNFFVLGGHSLAAARLAGRIRESFGVDLPLRDIFERPTVAALARRLGDLAPAAAATAAAAMTEAPLSPAQRRLFFLEGLGRSTGAVPWLYHVPVAFRLDGRLDREPLRAGLRAVVALHPGLRTRVVETPRGPRQRVEDGVEVNLPLVDLTVLGREVRDRQEEALCRCLARRPFDLGAPLLPRAVLLRVGRSRHVLSVTLHHLVADGAALDVFLADWASLATAVPPPGGADGPLAAHRGYAAYAADRVRWLEGGEAARQEKYWGRRLRGVPPQLHLPADPPAGPAPPGAGGSLRTTAGAESTQALRRLARDAGASVFMVVLAAFQAFLQRMGNDDVVVGAPVDLRSGSIDEGTVGHFVNTLPLRARPQGDEPFQRLLERVREDTLEDLAHRQLPFERIVEASGVERLPGRPPLVRAMLLVEEAGGPAFSVPGVEVVARPVPLDAAKFDLALNVRHGTGGMELEWEWARELFEIATVERWAGQFLALLQGAVTGPHRRIGELPLLGGAERRLLLGPWGGDRPAPSADLLHRRFLAQARETPEADALLSGDARLTYGALEERSRVLAAELASAGIGPEEVVGVALPSSPAQVVALLAVLRAGGVYLPLDPRHPQRRRQRLLTDAGARVLVGAAGDSPPAGFGGRVLSLGAGGLLAAVSEAKALLSPTLSPDNPAYLMYTSGSTGEPKGVLVPHAGIAGRLSWSLADHPLEPGERFLSIAAVGFDIAVWEALYPLSAGGVLVLPAAGRAADPGHLLDLLRRHRVRAIHFLPSLLGAFLEAVGEAETAAGLDLSLVITGGESLPPSVLHGFRSLFPEVRLIHAYGPTEASVSIVHGDGGSGTGGRVPIGRPMPGARVRVADRGGRLVGQGVEGELLLGGPGLARGYLARPAETAARFVPDPHGSEPGGRLYRTGDLARFGAGGELEFRGRVDHQVKLRGHRIEVGEIEAVLAAHPRVSGAAVTMVDGDRPWLAAYVVPTGSDADEDLVEELPAWLGRRLPAALVPARFIRLEDLPRTATGKLDRAALPRPDRASAGQSAAEAPRTPEERALAEIFAELLESATGGGGVSRDDDFFRLGGDSIASIQLVARARLRGLEISLRQVFEEPTVARLAAVATALPELATGSAEGAPAVRPVAGRPRAVSDLPPTPAQDAFLRTSMPAPHHFNQSQFWTVAASPGSGLGTLAGRVTAVWGALVERHDALRARPAGGGGEPRLCIAAGPAVAPRCPVVDLEALAPRRRTVALEAAARRVQGSLAPAEGRTWRLCLFAVGEAGSGHRAGRLLAVLHHLVTDAVSWRILFQELDAGLDGLAEGASPRWPVPSATLADWALGMAEAAASATEAEHWRQVLEAPGIRPLPLAGAGGSAPEGDSLEVTVELTEEEVVRLEGAVATAFRGRLGDALLAALGQTLAGWTGGDEVLLFVEGHGREPWVPGLDASRTVGWLTATYPLRLHLPQPDDPVASFLEAKERRRAVPAGGAGYGILRQRGFRPDPESRGRPDVIFNDLGRWGRPRSGRVLGPAPESAGPDVAPRNPRRAPLEVTAARREGRGLRVSFSHVPAQLRPATVERWAERFRHHLADLGRAAEAPGAFAYSPSDFPDAGLDAEALAAALGGVPGVEDVYPLAPMQSGFLFHSLARPGSQAYFTQILVELSGKLDEECMQWAWREVTARHGVLRTGFLWADVPAPVQFVAEAAELPWRRVDLGGLEEGVADARLDALLEEDRAAGFDLAHPPLQRLHWVERGDGRCLLVWSHHHILLDGWSVARVLEEVLTLYRVRMEGRRADLPGVRPYRDYVRWLQAQDAEAAHRSWCDHLADLDQPLLLGRPSSDGASDPGRTARPEVVDIHLDGDHSDALRRLAQAGKVTLSSLMQGAWAFLLARYTQRREVVFGVVVAGRPPELAGVEEMVGLFINTLPRRVRVGDDEELVAFLRRLQAEMVDLQQHSYLPLNKIRECVGLDRGRDLFDHIFVFENYPLQDATAAAGDALVRVDDVRTLEQTEYPLTVSVLPGECLRIELSRNDDRLTSAEIKTLAGYFEHVLLSLAAGAPEAT